MGQEHPKKGHFDPFLVPFMEPVKLPCILKLLFIHGPTKKGQNHPFFGHFDPFLVPFFDTLKRACILKLLFIYDIVTLYFTPFFMVIF